MLATLRSVLSARVVKGELLIVFLVYPRKHLSRESRKLTVMIQRELVSYSEVKNLLRFFPHYATDRLPQSGVYSSLVRINKIPTRGCAYIFIVKLLWLSEGDKAT